MPITQPSLYAITLVIAIVGSAIYWIYRSQNDPAIPLIYLFALASAFLGAKIVYLLSEGWMHWADSDRLLHLVTGKSVTGALLGGFAGVELAKKALRYPHSTGDRFAAVLPLALIIGRLGCLSHGCCQGILYKIGPLQRWPAVSVEIAFNLLAFSTFWIMRRQGKLPHQHFHLYLIAYGLFRFAHEFLRATPKPFAGLSGYQITAILLALLGALAFSHRQKNANQATRFPE